MDRKQQKDQDAKMKMLERFFLYGRLLRWDRPTGSFFLFLPCLWGLVLGTKGFPPFYPIFLFFMGAFFMRSVGCVYNDLVDRKLDCHVKRTQNRPLAIRQVSPPEAIGLMFCLSLVSLWILFQFNDLTIFWGVVSLLMILLYPWMKRITFWPQFFLGLTFNWGVLMGFASTSSPWGFNVFFLYFAGVLWTLAYDTIYAYQDYSDDLSIGIKSSAVKLGDDAKVFLSFLGVCWALMIILLGFVGLQSGFRLHYFWGLFIVVGHFLWQGWTLDVRDPRNCEERFRANSWVGVLVFLLLLAGQP